VTISTKSLPRPFNVYNSDGSRNVEKTIKEFVPLEINSNGHIKQIDAVVLEIKKTIPRTRLASGTQPRSRLERRSYIVHKMPRTLQMEHESIRFTLWSRRLLPKEEE